MPAVGTSSGCYTTKGLQQEDFDAAWLFYHEQMIVETHLALGCQGVQQARRRSGPPRANAESIKHSDIDRMAHWSCILRFGLKGARQGVWSSASTLPWSWGAVP